MSHEIAAGECCRSPSPINQITRTLNQISCLVNYGVEFWILLVLWIVLVTRVIVAAGNGNGRLLILSRRGLIDSRLTVGDEHGSCSSIKTSYSTGTFPIL